jgi:colanic acid/amylovoran biosynthesis protein
MFAGSPGPFGSTWRRMLAKFVLNRVDLITNREPLSTELLQEMGITNTHMVTTACPAFLFDAKRKEEAMDVLKNERILPKTKPLVGFILSGWNMPKPPFFKVPRDDEELKPFVDLIGHILEHYDVKVVLMAHQNRTDDQGNLIPGSDYHIISQLYSLLNHQYQDDELTMVKGLYDAATMKTIIGCCDFLISGRLHGAIAGLSQCIPTVIIDYGNGPRPHKLRGIAKLVGIEAYICDPTNAQDMIEKVSLAWENRDRIREYLKKRMPEVKKLAKYNFEILHSISK